MPDHPYSGLRVSLATQHGKARALAPPLARRLGLIVEPVAIATDAFGTFTGTTLRAGTAAEAALAKARAGMAASGLDLGLASEGSFGPHPWLPFGAGGVETLAFVDAPRGLELTLSAVSRRTNFAQHEVTDGGDIAPFLTRIGFPSHALVVKGPDGAVLATGVQDMATLSPLAWPGNRLETDMRAHMNPTRMAAIRALAGRLAARLGTRCPACGAPGWGQVDLLRGLPCSSCNQPTQGVLAIIDGCGVCAHRGKRPRPDGVTAASPASCDWCNP
ncbi:DUF6671 family protein [Sandarakinorhabdus sp. AAP62]|uniref:DUF6671 family protein n=1 Tax=Sandarakinorhabdus sp. AAP62 TaxID=1248916 RepID=UPI00030A0AFA|nr:DUF6671 family protein [Sandarakinorhabdus sp. AAP62]